MRALPEELHEMFEESLIMIEIDTSYVEGEPATIGFLSSARLKDRMVENAWRYSGRIADYKTKSVTFHPETAKRIVDRLIQRRLVEQYAKKTVRGPGPRWSRDKDSWLLRLTELGVSTSITNQAIIIAATGVWDPQLDAKLELIANIQKVRLPAEYLAFRLRMKMHHRVPGKSWENQLG